MSDVSLPTGLREAVRGVHVDRNQLTATVNGREVEADSPRQLRRLLANALYETLHTGQKPIEGPIPFRSRDAEFEGQLTAAVGHRFTSVPGRVQAVVPPDADREALHLVALEGVRVWVPGRSLASDGAAVGDLVTVSLAAARPALSPGFLMVYGTRVHRSAELLRVYLHIADPAHAPGIWGAVLARLEAAGGAYRAKVLSSREAYPRRDSLVVYLDSDSRQLAVDLADLVAGRPGMGEETSVFARRLGPGVAVAWEPKDGRPGMGGLSFGQHRASVVAEALVERAVDGADPAVAEALAAALLAANVDPADVSRNLDSPRFADLPVSA